MVQMSFLSSIQLC